MSDDFEMDMDTAFFAEVDQIANNALASQKRTPDESFDHYYTDSIPLDEAAFRELDRLEAAVVKPPVAGPSTSSQLPSRTQSLQTTLFGTVLQPKSTHSTFRRTQSQSQSQSNVNRANKIKTWPKDAFRKHGWKIDKDKKKGKRRAADDEQGEDEDDDDIEFEQFPSVDILGEISRSQQLAYMSLISSIGP